MKRNEDSTKFRDSLCADDLGGLISVPKSDLHNHAGRGGNLAALAEWWGVKIALPEGTFRSLGAMDNT